MYINYKFSNGEKHTFAYLRNISYKCVNYVRTEICYVIVH